MDCIRAIKRGPRLEKDKGYAWLILVMSFLSHSLHLGFSLALLGNLTVANQSHFGISLQQSSTIGSVHTGLFFFLGPVASIIVKKLGCRFAEVMGGVCLVVGISVLSVSSESWHAYILFSILAAFGISNTYTATSEILALHFDRHKYLAFSLACLGYYVGMAVWPSVSQKLLDQLGYSKAMVIMSTWHVVHIIAGILFYEPKADTDSVNEEVSSKSSSITDEKISEDENKNTDVLGEDNPAMDYTDITLSVETREKLEKSDSELSRREENSSETDSRHGVLDDFKILFKSAKVWALLISGLLWNICTTAFLILINDFILTTTDMEKSAVSFGITIIGIANIVGCVGVIATSSLNFDRLRLHVCAILLYSTATIIMSFTNGKVMYYALAVVWGLGQGALIANLLAVVYDFCGADQLALLFGLHLCAEGIGAFIGTPISGVIEQNTSAKYGILFAGVCGVIGGLFIIPVIVSKARKAKAAEGLTLKAIVLANVKGNNGQQNVIDKINEAAGPEYPHLHHIQSDDH